jgi:hypothetical protein
MRLTRISVCVLVVLAGCGDESQPVRSIGIDELRDKIAGAWVGQFAGVAWGMTTEFAYQGEIMPEEEVPEWEPDMVNIGFVQDDVYVEIPFLITLREHGVDCDWSHFGDAFADTSFALWHANRAGRENLQAGIPVPDSGHYLNNPHCDDIDWQIESDFAGIIAPGLPSVAAEIAWRGGHVMNYGDGVYGGAWVAAMHAEAYLAGSVEEIVEAGRRVVPEGSLFRQVQDDVIAWHRRYPDDWTETWHELEDKWGAGDRCPEGMDQPYNIDAKLNGAYVLIGLLYGKGDFEDSVRIAMRCGQDSDCNPSTVGSILGNFKGLSGIPLRFKTALDSGRFFSHTSATLDDCLAWCEDLAYEIYRYTGGSVTGTSDAEIWTAPKLKTRPLILEQWPLEENPSPALNSEIVRVDGLTATLSAQALDADGIGEYMWFFGDLGYASGRRIQHTYREPGTYSVLSYASDELGNTSWRALSVTAE